MKTLLQTLFFFLLVTQIGLAQWYQQNSSTTKNLNAVQFVDEYTGWAVGDSGTILKTTDLGNSWNVQSSGTTYNLYDVQFIDANVGWIVGNAREYNSGGSVLLHTTDAGLNWIQQMVDINLTYLYSIYFLNNTSGWMGGIKDTEYTCIPAMLRTTDGGSNWDNKFIASSLPGGGWSWMDVYFINTDVGYAAYGGGNIGGCFGKIFKTTNGGETWDEQIAPSYAYSSIEFFDVQCGFAAANCCGMFCGNTGNILRTQDGGINWILVFEPPAGGTPKGINDITFFDTESILAVGANEFSEGTILFSSDLGENWSSQGLYSNPLNAIDFISSTSGWAVGNNGTILHTTNGGVSFIEEEQLSKVPTEFLLSQNWPNPFNPSTKIKYSVPQSSNIILKAFDVLGNEIETLVNEEKPAGTYELTWYAENLPSGVYFYQLKAGNYIDTKKMILLK